MAAYARDLESERESLEEQLEESRKAIPVIEEVHSNIPCLSSLCLLKTSQGEGAAVLLNISPFPGCVVR